MNIRLKFMIIIILCNCNLYNHVAFIYTSIMIDFMREKLKNSASKITLAGHSLGEYAALYFANSLNFEDMLRVVKFRGEAMSIVSDPSKYMM